MDTERLTQEIIMNRLKEKIEIDPKTNCHLLRNKSRSPSVSVNGISHSSSRFVWKYYKGLIPDGLNVCHTCDNRRCLNIDHLFLGTQSENMKDCVEKKRHNKPTGANHYKSKLTEDQVREIKNTPRYHGCITDLAKKYNVLTHTIKDIRTGNTWRDVN